MKIRFIITIAIISISFLKPSLVHAQGSKTCFRVNDRKINIDSLETQIKFLMGEIGIAGLSFAVIDQKKIVYYNSFGYKRIEEKQKQMIDKETVFEACSLSKSFLAYAAYIALEKGLLDFDKPLYEYLEYEPLEYDERYKLITARMVLGHNSGLENHKVENDPKILEIIASPGEKFVYSGEGYIFLSKVLEKLTNQSTQQYLDSLVFEPLQLERTYTTFTDLIEKGKGNYASGHNVFGQELVKLKNTKPDVIARIHTNAKDYAKLMIGFFNEERLVGDKILDSISRTGEGDDFDMYYGPGFEILRTKNDTILFQEGNNDGYKGLACYSIKNKSGFVFIANSDRSEKISTSLNKLTTAINIGDYFGSIYANQYPNNANKIYSIYRNQGLEDMKKELSYFLNTDEDSLTESDVVELAYYFKDKEYETIKWLVDKYIEKYPNSKIDFIYKRWLNK